MYLLIYRLCNTHIYTYRHKTLSQRYTNFVTTSRKRNKNLYHSHILQLFSFQQCLNFLFQQRHVINNNSPKDIGLQRIICMYYKVSCIHNFSGSCYRYIWVNLQGLIHSFPHYFHVPLHTSFLSTPLRKRVSLQKVAYSLGRFSINDSISSIEKRMSERYFLNFLSIDQIFSSLKFLFEIRILDR